MLDNFEYMVLRELPRVGTESGTYESIQSVRLNHQGSQGWELCTVNRNGFYIFRRVRQPVVVSWWRRVWLRRAWRNIWLGSFDDHDGTDRYYCEQCCKVLTIGRYSNSFCTIVCESKFNEVKDVE